MSESDSPGPAADEQAAAAAAKPPWEQTLRDITDGMDTMEAKFNDQIKAMRREYEKKLDEARSQIIEATLSASPAPLPGADESEDMDAAKYHKRLYSLEGNGFHISLDIDGGGRRKRKKGGRRRWQ